MGVYKSIRNFFYAATHANQLISEIENNRTTIDMQREELSNMRSAVEAAYREKLRWKDMYEKSNRATVVSRPENMNANQPVGKIEYLGFSGEVIESIAYTDASQFVQQIKEDNYCGVPMDITVFSDPKNGSHIDTSWRLDLDPPPQGFQIKPYLMTGPVPELELEV